MKRDTDHTYTLLLTVHNNPGVLVRCAQVFNRRGHNIEALRVTPAHNSHTQSQMAITAFGDMRTINQITMQLHKLIDVLDVAEEK